MFFGYNRSYSVTLMLAELNLPCFDNFMAANSKTFVEQWSLCFNSLVSNYNIACSSNLLHGLTAFYYLFFSLFFCCYFLCLYIYTSLLLYYE